MQKNFKTPLTTPPTPCVGSDFRHPLGQESLSDLPSQPVSNFIVASDQHHRKEWVCVLFLFYHLDIYCEVLR